MAGRGLAEMMKLECTRGLLRCGARARAHLAFDAAVWAGSTLTEVLGYKVQNFVQRFVQTKDSSATKPLYKLDHTRSQRLVKPKVQSLGSLSLLLLLLCFFRCELNNAT